MAVTTVMVLRSRVFISAWLLAGCIGDDTSAEGEVSQNVIAPNGVSLNGVSLNGVSLNGTTISAVSTGQPLTGTSAVGSKWTAKLSNGATLPLRIDSAVVGTGTNSDLWMYGISYQTSTTWTPLCGVDAALAPVLAVTVAGVWNTQSGVAGGGAYTSSSTQFTIACRAKTIAKCVELGYKTWKGYTNQLTSCVRLLRADFCGDGTPHTVDGQTLNLYDNVGVQADTQPWSPEAEWTPAGARCVTKTGETRFSNLGLAVPACVKGKELTTTCGTSFGPGTTLIDELPTNLMQ
ncbi:hypothetical protein BH11MYX1_BH11MYX1_14500 [soil metagenome]